MPPYYPQNVNMAGRENAYQASIYANQHGLTQPRVMSLIPPWLTQEASTYLTTQPRDEDTRESIAEARHTAEFRTDGEGEDTMNDQYDEDLRQPDHPTSENVEEQPLTTETSAQSHKVQGYDEKATSPSAHTPPFPLKICSWRSESRGPRPDKRRRSPCRSQNRSVNSRTDSERPGRYRDTSSIEDLMTDLEYEIEKLKSAMHERRRSLRSLRNLQRDNQALVDEVFRNRELSGHGKVKQAKSEDSSRY
jgi:hypothetical protein